MNFFLLQHIKLFFCSQSEKEFFLKIKHLLGFAPNSVFYYKKAFTHKSANCFIDGIKICNERLEYLGDTILDSIIADYLFHVYPFKSEGFLTQLKSRIVNRKSLNDIAKALHLDAFIESNITDVKNNDAMGNAFEALVGAIYLDKGYNVTKRFLIDKILDNFFDFSFLEKVDANYKSKLLEIVQKQNNFDIKFDTSRVNQEVSNSFVHSFVSIVYVNNIEMAKGTGKTKKDSEQHAAQLAIKNMAKSNSRHSV
ncbi:MAG: ribonuclease III [Bacteroidales bacterium]